MEPSTLEWCQKGPTTNLNQLGINSSREKKKIDDQDKFNKIIIKQHYYDNITGIAIFYV